MLRAGVAAAGLYTGLAVVFAAPASAHRRACPPPHSRVLAANGRTRVFTVTRRNRFGDRFRVAYACLRPHGRRYPLEDPDPRGGGPTHARGIQAGPAAVGWVSTYESAAGDFDFARAESLDLRTNRRRDCPPVSAARDAGGSENVLALRLGRADAVAWIGQSSGFGGSPGPLEVGESSGASTACTVLDGGRDIDPSSLAVSANGRTVYWTRDGKPRAADFR